MNNTPNGASDEFGENSRKLNKEEKKRLKNEKFSSKKQLKNNHTTKNDTLIKKDLSIKYIHTGDFGCKKDTTCPLPDKFHPSYVEAGWYAWWQKEKFFDPEHHKSIDEIKKLPLSEKFITIMPPPNVTGTLHIGHALMCAIEDTMARWNRMRGKLVLWNPGCDHAGIATQVVVEKKLKIEKNLSRHDLGREKFLKEVWNWKSSKEGFIVEQLNRMGVSVDWNRSFFTMDQARSRAVEEAFILLHERGLIYRAQRLVNWSCALNSAISDIEVDKVEISGRKLLSLPCYDQKVEFGVLIDFAYLLDGSTDRIVVSTTRVETMLGDVAVAVHPDDCRFKNLVGKYLRHPFCNRLIPIICDMSVEQSFGTGAVKITPAHDPVDYEVGKRHNLTMINILDDNGCIVNDLNFREGYQKFSGLKRFDARRLVLEELTKLNLFVNKTDHTYVVPFCSRSKDVIEPVLKSQWFVDCSNMATKAINLVKSHTLQIFPSTHEKTWYRWMESIQDWCISRQLWWGHRIPAYYVTSSELPSSHPDKSDFWVSATSLDEAYNKASKKFKVSTEKLFLKRDEDVLDTWFSSGLLPFSTFGWPEDLSKLDAFYPLNVLETGYDILFFWVARMVMLSLELIDSPPFLQVVLHPIIRDSHGRKMSKSLGNIIDPVDVIEGISLNGLHDRLLSYNLSPSEFQKAKQGQIKDFPSGIPECGSDALRFTLCIYSASKKDINLDILRAQGYRFFCNKIWNAVRFCLNNFGSFIYDKNFIITNATSIDRWILSRLSSAEDTSNYALSEHDFASCCTALYNFWWYDFCDIYIECSKPILFSNNQNQISTTRHILMTCIDNGLRLLSPIMPFITEELYQRLPFPKSHLTSYPSICVSPYPYQLPWRDEILENSVATVFSTVTLIRSTKDQYVSSKTPLTVFLQCHSSDAYNLFKSYIDIIKALTKTSDLIITADSSKIPPGCVVTPNGTVCNIHLLLKGTVDIQKEIMKTKDLIKKTEDNKSRLVTLINTPEYKIKVPDFVKDSNSAKLSQLETELIRLNEIMQCLELAK